MAADALLGRAEQVESLEPLVERDVAALENGSDRHSERLLAVPALADTTTGALALQGIDAIGSTTMGADRPVRPQRRLDVGERGVFIVKGGGGKIGCGH